MFLKFLKNIKYTIILVVVILGVVGYVGFRWYEGRMFFVNNGMASPKFPFRQYTLLEVARQGRVGDFNDEDRAKFQQELRDLPTRITPKETFDIYIQALKDGDIERALSCFIEGENTQQHFREFLYIDKKDGTLEKDIEISEDIKSRIPWNKEKIEKNSTGKVGVYYSFTCIYDESATCNIGFSKDLYGDWKIANL